MIECTYVIIMFFAVFKGTYNVITYTNSTLGRNSHALILFIQFSVREQYDIHIFEILYIFLTI